MGAVYLAHDDGIDRDVAIKLVRVDDAGLRRRFQSEAQSAGRLKHPNIVTVYEYGEFHGGPYLVMEHIEGETLAQLAERQPSLDTATKLGLLIQACAGLGYAHRCGVVHRDIKPSNLMVDKDGVLKVVDFGIARTSGRDLTVTGKMVGTPAYMAPEQLQGDGVDHRSDIFALGLVVFELLSGQCAYTGDSDYALINRIVNGAPNSFRHPVRSLEPLIQPVLDKALAKNPAMRHQSADRLADDLERVRSQIGANPRPEAPGSDTAATVLLPTTPPGQAPASRHWAAVAVLGAVAVTAVALIAINGPTFATPTRPADVPDSSTSVVAPLARQPESNGAEAVAAKASDSPQPSIATAPPAPTPRLATATVANVLLGPPTDKPAIASILTAAHAAVAATDYDAAIARFEQARSLDPANVAATEGIAAARRAQERIRAATIRSRLADAEQKLSDGAYDDAISIFESILQSDAGNTEALDGVTRSRRARAAEEAIFKQRTKKPSGGQ